MDSGGAEALTYSLSLTHKLNILNLSGLVKGELLPKSIASTNEAFGGRPHERGVATQRGNSLNSRCFAIWVLLLLCW